MLEVELLLKTVSMWRDMMSDRNDVAWELVRQSTENNQFPDQLPNDAIVILADNLYNSLLDSGIKFNKNIFISSRLLPVNQVIITKINEFKEML